MSALYDERPCAKCGVAEVVHKGATKIITCGAYVAAVTSPVVSPADELEMIGARVLKLERALLALQARVLAVEWAAASYRERYPAPAAASARPSQLGLYDFARSAA